MSMTLAQMESIALDLRERVKKLENRPTSDSLAVPNNWYINQEGDTVNQIEEVNLACGRLYCEEGALWWEDNGTKEKHLISNEAGDTGLIPPERGVQSDAIAGYMKLLGWNRARAGIAGEEEVLTVQVQEVATPVETSKYTKLGEPQTNLLKLWTQAVPKWAALCRFQLPIVLNNGAAHNESQTVEARLELRAGGEVKQTVFTGTATTAAAYNATAEIGADVVFAGASDLELVVVLSTTSAFNDTEWANGYPRLETLTPIA